MEAVYYSEKSIAIYGDTKPYASYLRDLGGKFNNNLNGKPGWIFPKTKEGEILKFLGEAASGQVQSQNYQQSQMAQLVPMSQNRPAMNPNDALSRLTAMQRKPPSPNINRKLPSPRTVLEPVITTLNFPNRFIGADGLSYQILIYTVPLPRIGQSVTITVGIDNFEYTVTSLENQTDNIDNIILTQVVMPEAGGTEPGVSKAVIVNGEWKIFGMIDEHIITFNV